MKFLFNIAVLIPFRSGHVLDWNYEGGVSFDTVLIPFRSGHVLDYLLMPSMRRGIRLNPF